MLSVERKYGRGNINKSAGGEAAGRENAGWRLIMVTFET